MSPKDTLAIASRLMSHEGIAGKRVVMADGPGGSYLTGDGHDWIKAIRSTAPSPFHEDVYAALRLLFKWLMERESTIGDGWARLDASEEIDKLDDGQVELAVANLWNEYRSESRNKDLASVLKAASK